MQYGQMCCIVPTRDRLGCQRSQHIRVFNSTSRMHNQAKTRSSMQGRLDQPPSLVLIHLPAVDIKAKGQGHAETQGPRVSL